MEAAAAAGKMNAPEKSSSENAKETSNAYVHKKWPPGEFNLFHIMTPNILL